MIEPTAKIKSNDPLWIIKNKNGYMMLWTLSLTPEHAWDKFLFGGQVEVGISKDEAQAKGLVAACIKVIEEEHG